MRPFILFLVLVLGLGQCFCIIASVGVSQSVREVTSNDRNIKRYINRHKIALMIGAFVLTFGAGMVWVNALPIGNKKEAVAGTEATNEYWRRVKVVSDIKNNNTEQPVSKPVKRFSLQFKFPTLPQFFTRREDKVSVSAGSVLNLNDAVPPEIKNIDGIEYEIVHSQPSDVNCWEHIPATLGIQGTEVVRYTGFEKGLQELKMAAKSLVNIISPWKPGACGWYDIDYVHVIGDIIVIALIVDVGYNLITNKPEVAELIYKWIAKKIKKK